VKSYNKPINSEVYMTKNNRKILPFLLIFVFLGSCTEFFSTSWAPWAARDPSRLIPPVTLDNVYELIALAENDPDLSLELLLGIGEAVDNASGQDKTDLQVAAVEAAVNAAGMGQTLLGSGGEISNLDDRDSAKEAAIDAIEKMPNLEETSAALFDILPPKEGPEFDAFVNTASAEDIALAAILLLSGEAKKSEDDVDHFIDTFDENTSEETALALALTGSLAGREDELPTSLFNILSGLNLI